jgi:ABC-type proline/glycine betaine transport system permease subunit
VAAATVSLGYLFYNHRVPVGDWVESVVNWLTTSLGGLFDWLSSAVNWMTGGLEELLLWPPALVIAVIFGLIGWKVRGYVFGAFSLLGFMLISSMLLWKDAMSTLSLVLVATIIAVVIGLPLGILAAKNELTSATFKPVLDFMQTMPAFVYLIPAIIFFGIGKVPGVFATVIFAMPPAVRLTELGIRQVDSEVVEAAEAFGAPPFKVLRSIQIPLALPTIMAGINQVIMLSLSMVVIAGIVGAGGLGAVVYRGVTRLNVGLGFEGGLAVVILAIFLDRLTASLSGNKVGERVGTA